MLKAEDCDKITFTELCSEQDKHPLVESLLQKLVDVTNQITMCLINLDVRDWRVGDFCSFVWSDMRTKQDNQSFNSHVNIIHIGTIIQILFETQSLTLFEREDLNINIKVRQYIDRCYKERTTNTFTQESIQKEMEQLIQCLTPIIPKLLASLEMMFPNRVGLWRRKITGKSTPSQLLWMFSVLLAYVSTLAICVIEKPKFTLCMECVFEDELSLIRNKLY